MGILSKFNSFLIILSICACSTIDSNRNPSSISNNQFQILQQIQNEKDLLASKQIELASFKMPAASDPTSRGGSSNNASHRQALQRKKQLENSLNSSKAKINELTRQLSINMGPQTQHIKIKHLNPLLKIEKLNIANTKAFLFENSGHQNHFVELEFDESNSLNLSMKCDGEFTLSKNPKAPSSNLMNNHDWRLQPLFKKQQLRYISFNQNTKKCQLSVKNIQTKTSQLIHLRKNSSSYIEKLTTQHEACILKKPTDQTSVTDRMFYSSEFDNFSCPTTAHHVGFLDNSYRAFSKKFEVLTGQELSDETILQANPYLKIDFSNAPTYDSIIISGLVYRADFGGVLLARALEHHAKNGTDVKIFISDAVALDKDVSFLNSLTKKYPNFKVQFFKYPKNATQKLDDIIQSIHRVNHLKALVTTSQSIPENNHVIIGGRNIHDGFIFKSVPDLSKHPEIVQYGDKKDESFVHWMDLELHFQSPELSQQLMSQILGIWNRDSLTASFMTPFIQLPVDENKFQLNALQNDSPKIRSLVSVPYRDEQDLEKFFIKLIDSSTKTINIVSPYLRLTKPIRTALERAIERDIPVKIFTRIDMTGDFAAALLSDVNKGTINKIRDKVQVYEWLEVGIILHSKAILIDDEISFVSGVNLNKRSFIHDWENGILLKDRSINAKIKEIMNGYQQGSRLVTEKQKMKWWTVPIIAGLDDKF